MKKLLILLMLPLFLLAPVAKAEVFTDVHDEHFSGEAIDYLKTESIVEGYSDGSYKPENRINRAEFIKIIVEAKYDAKEIEACTQSPFTDVPAGEWYTKYVCTAKDKGIIAGYPDGTFRPASFINFAEAAKIVSESQEVDTDNTGTNGEWFAGYVKGLEKRKAIPTTIQFFDREITRGDMAELIWRLKANRQDKVTATYEEITEPLPAIASCPALYEKFDQYQRHNQYRGGFIDDVMFAVEESAEADGESAPTAPVANLSAGAQAKSQSADDFSQTNVQVQGVDEADIIKNDGEFVYLVKDDTVRIVKAYPADDMQEVSAIDFDQDGFRPSELFLSEDRLVVIGQVGSYYSMPYLEEVDVEVSSSMMLPAYQENQSVIYVYDISNRSNPKQIRELAFQGNYSTSRRIGDKVYLVMNAKPNGWNWGRVEEGEDLIPSFRDGSSSPEPLVGCSDIRYFPGYTTPNYLITAAIDISSSNTKVQRNMFLGSGENVYSSRTHLYVARTVVDRDRYTDWDWSRDSSKTHVFRFALEDGEINFKARGEVPGRILNQFSMDAYKNHFRIATTKGNTWNEANIINNNVYVLDGDMKQVGALEGLAKGERIFSTRFMSDRLYMVTFKQVDPLFVIDLSTPTNPVVLGELKIPGFSEYLHPYDSDHIIGFGKETSEDEDDRVRVEGLKMALFDVSDVKNPKQKFVEVIGDRGSYSELLYNHKALLFDKDKDLIAFPATIQEKINYSELQCGKYVYDSCPASCSRRCIPTECTVDELGIATCTEDCSGVGSCTDSNYDRYYTAFQGALVYNIDLEDGFSERGRVTHLTEDEIPKLGDYWPYDSGKLIQRIIYIGENLYTIANGGIKASTLDTVEEIKLLDIK